MDDKITRRTFMEKVLGASASVTDLEGEEQTPQMNAAEAQKFVEESAFEIPEEHLEEERILNVSTCCVDDRRPKGETGLPPECAIPGADAGVIGNILAASNQLELSLEIKKKLVDKYIELKGGLGNLRFHTDEDAEKKYQGNKDATAEGCGHFKHSTDPKNQEAYFLNPEDVEIIKGKLREAKKEGCTIEILRGKHNIAAVMVIDEETLGLKHGKALIYNRALHKKMLGVLSKNLAADAKVDAEQLKQTLFSINDIQLDATLSRIALNSQIYSVKKDSKGNLETIAAGEVK